MYNTRRYIDATAYESPDEIKRILRQHHYWYRTREDGVVEYQSIEHVSEPINWADYGYTDI